MNGFGSRKCECGVAPDLEPPQNQFLFCLPSPWSVGLLADNEDLLPMSYPSLMPCMPILVHVYPLLSYVP